MAAIANLSETHFRATPPTGGWSVAQVFEHLCLSGDAYVDRAIPEALERARSRGSAGRPYRTSLVGGLLIGAMRESNRHRLPSPKPWRAGPQVRPEVVQHFLAGVERLGPLLDDAERTDPCTSIASPASALLRMHLGDAFVILAEHAHRHLAQVERTRRAVGG